MSESCVQDGSAERLGGQADKHLVAEALSSLLQAVSSPSPRRQCWGPVGNVEKCTILKMDSVP